METERDRLRRGGEREWERERETETERQRDRQTETETERQTDRQTDREGGGGKIGREKKLGERGKTKEDKTDKQTEKQENEIAVCVGVSLTIEYRMEVSFTQDSGAAAVDHNRRKAPRQNSSIWAGVTNTTTFIPPSNLRCFPIYSACAWCY